MHRTSRPRQQSLGIRTAAIAALLVLVQILALSCSRSLTATTAPLASHARATGAPNAIGTLPDDPVEGEVVITLADGVDVSELAASYSASVVSQVSDAHAVALLPAAGQTVADLQQQLSLDTRVVSAEPNGWLETAEARQQSFAFDDGFGSPSAVAGQPAVAAVHLDQAHVAATGRGVTVAILDTGIDPNHPDLRGAYAGGVDFVAGDLDPTEEREQRDDDLDGHVDEAFGHGTHVAGIIHLVAPDARLLAVRVLDSDGRGSLLDVVAGVRWAMEHGAKVINLSLGSLTKSDALQRTLEDARSAGVAVVVAAGNWGDDKPVEFPAASRHVAAIGAVDATDRPAEFSSFGDNVALAAPGVAVRSTYPGGEYRLWSGTSMSAPFVAGTCALLAETHPDWSIDQMLARIGAAAAPVREPDGVKFGAGVLDIGAALAPDVRPRADEEPVPEVLRQRR